MNLLSEYGSDDEEDEECLPSSASCHTTSSISLPISAAPVKNIVPHVNTDDEDNEPSSYDIPSTFSSINPKSKNFSLSLPPPQSNSGVTKAIPSSPPPVLPSLINATRTEESAAVGPRLPTSASNPLSKASAVITSLKKPSFLNKSTLASMITPSSQIFPKLCDKSSLYNDDSDDDDSLYVAAARRRLNPEAGSNFESSTASTSSILPPSKGATFLKSLPPISNKAVGVDRGNNISSNGSISISDASGKVNRMTAREGVTNPKVGGGKSFNTNYDDNDDDDDDKVFEADEEFKRSARALIKKRPREDGEIENDHDDDDDDDDDGDNSDSGRDENADDDEIGADSDLDLERKEGNDVGSVSFFGALDSFSSRHVQEIPPPSSPPPFPSTSTDASTVDDSSVASSSSSSTMAAAAAVDQSEGGNWTPEQKEAWTAWYHYQHLYNQQAHHQHPDPQHPDHQYRSLGADPPSSMVREATGGIPAEENEEVDLFALALAKEQERLQRRMGGAGGWGKGNKSSVSNGLSNSLSHSSKKPRVPTIEFKEISAAALTRDAPQRMAAEGLKGALGPEYENELRMSAKRFEGSKMAKRKHQIGTLYYNSRMQEVDNLERDAQKHSNRNEAKAKYGW